MARLSQNGSLVKYQDNVATRGQSAIPVLTSAHVEQLNMLPLIQTAAAISKIRTVKKTAVTYTLTMYRRSIEDIS